MSMVRTPAGGLGMARSRDEYGRGAGLVSASMAPGPVASRVTTTGVARPRAHAGTRLAPLNPHLAPLGAGGGRDPSVDDDDSDSDLEAALARHGVEPDSHLGYGEYDDDDDDDDEEDEILIDPAGRAAAAAAVAAGKVGAGLGGDSSDSGGEGAGGHARVGVLATEEAPEFMAPYARNARSSAPEAASKYYEEYDDYASEGSGDGDGDITGTRVSAPLVSRHPLGSPTDRLNAAIAPGGVLPGAGMPDTPPRRKHKSKSRDRERDRDRERERERARERERRGGHTATAASASTTPSRGASKQAARAAAAAAAAAAAGMASTAHASAPESAGAAGEGEGEGEAGGAPSSIRVSAKQGWASSSPGTSPSRRGGTGAGGGVPRWGGAVEASPSHAAGDLAARTAGAGAGGGLGARAGASAAPGSATSSAGAGADAGGAGTSTTRAGGGGAAGAGAAAGGAEAGAASVPIVVDLEDFDAFVEANDAFSEDKLCRMAGAARVDAITFIELRVDTASGEHDMDVLAERLPALRSLKLNDSVLGSFRDLGTRFSELRVLWLNRSGVSELDGISALRSLRELYLAHNDVDDLTPLAMHDTLEILDLEANAVAEVDQVEVLGTCGALVNLNLVDNPVARTAQYRRIVVHNCVPGLKTLDDAAVTADDRQAPDDDAVTEAYSTPRTAAGAGAPGATPATPRTGITATPPSAPMRAPRTGEEPARPGAGGMKLDLSGVGDTGASAAAAAIAAAGDERSGVASPDHSMRTARAPLAPGASDGVDTSLEERLAVAASIKSGKQAGGGAGAGAGAGGGANVGRRGERPPSLSLGSAGAGSGGGLGGGSDSESGGAALQTPTPTAAAAAASGASELTMGTAFAGGLALAVRRRKKDAGDSDGGSGNTHRREDSHRDSPSANRRSAGGAGAGGGGDGAPGSAHNAAHASTVGARVWDEMSAIEFLDFSKALEKRPRNVVIEDMKKWTAAAGDAETTAAAAEQAHARRKAAGKEARRRRPNTAGLSGSVRQRQRQRAAAAQAAAAAATSAAAAGGATAGGGAEGRLAGDRRAASMSDVGRRGATKSRTRLARSGSSDRDGDTDSDMDAGGLSAGGPVRAVHGAVGGATTPTREVGAGEGGGPFTATGSNLGFDPRRHSVTGAGAAVPPRPSTSSGIPKLDFASLAAQRGGAGGAGGASGSSGAGAGGFAEAVASGGGGIAVDPALASVVGADGADRSALNSAQSSVRSSHSMSRPNSSQSRLSAETRGSFMSVGDGEAAASGAAPAGAGAMVGGGGGGRDSRARDSVTSVPSTGGGSRRGSTGSGSITDTPGEAVVAHDDDLVELLRKKPKHVPELRSRDGFRRYFRGITRSRMERLLQTAYDNLDPKDRQARVGRRLELLDGLFAPEED